MSANHEAELRVALAEGILTRTEAVALGEEAARALRSPLELLMERGKLSSDTLAELRADREKEWDPNETATLDPVQGRPGRGSRRVPEPEPRHGRGGRRRVVALRAALSAQPIDTIHALAFVPTPRLYFSTTYSLQWICNWQDQAMRIVATDARAATFRDQMMVFGAMDAQVMAERFMKPGMRVDAEGGFTDSARVTAS